MRTRCDDDGREFRVTSAPLELRDGPDKAVVARGYASVFGRESEDLGGFIEVIEANAFSTVMNDDVRALFNHDSNMILGRTRARTARIWQDASGLGYEVTLPDTSYARDLAVSMRRGDVTQSSFAFRVEKGGQRWVIAGDRIIRYITRISRLYDVSPVTFPAYPDATVALREMRERFGDVARVTPVSVLRRRMQLAAIDGGRVSNSGPSIDHMRRRMQLAERQS